MAKENLGPDANYVFTKQALGDFCSKVYGERNYHKNPRTRKKVEADMRTVLGATSSPRSDLAEFLKGKGYRVVEKESTIVRNYGGLSFIIKQNGHLEVIAVLGGPIANSPSHYIGQAAKSTPEEKGGDGEGIEGRVESSS